MKRLLFALCILGPSNTLGQSPSRDWRPDERTVVGDFSRITSVAATFDRVYVTSPATLLLWNPQLRRWEGPFDPPNRTVLDRVFGSLVDPLDNSVWLVRPDGWVHFSPDIHLWERGTIPANVRDIAFDLDSPTAGVFFLTSAGWLSLPRGAGSPVPSRPPSRPTRPGSIEEAIRANPSLQANSAQILLRGRLRSSRFTVAARAPDGRGWYIGTWGSGLFFLADGAPLPERIAFGLPGEVVSAVFAAPNGVWVANDRTVSSETALTFVAADLSEFRALEGSLAFGLPFTRVKKLVGQASSLWAATDQGVARVPADGSRIDLLDESRGLPDNRVLSITSRRGQIAAGTAHGLARITDLLTAERAASEFSDPAYAVALAGDSIWVGTPLGLFFALNDQTDLFQPAGLRSSPSFRAPVIAIGWQIDTLVALMQDRMIWRKPRSDEWTQGPDLSLQLGRLRVFAADKNGFWIGGERGIAFAGLGSPAVRPLLVPGDIPGEVLDLALDPEYLWVGTAAGLVRWKLDAIRP